ncbi:MAG: DinB family protein [Phycisphaerales bacterium]
MDRDSLLKLWKEHHTNNTWIPAWSKAVSDLTPEQAAWKPDPQRHSIWQQVNHMVFWRTYNLARKRGGEPLPDAEIQRRNWLAPDMITEAAWREARERFNTSHSEVADAIADGTLPPDTTSYLLTHDSYHVGQIMQLRAMQGMKPIE